MTLETELVKWVEFRERLIARRDELRAELTLIEAALSPVVAVQPNQVRRVGRSATGPAMRVEHYLREHPNTTARSIATALKIEINQANNALLNLLRRDFAVRERDDGKPWRWSMRPGVIPAPMPLPNIQETA